MDAAVLRSRWLPVLLAVIVADLNFWYFASTGENHADFVGMAFFAAFAAFDVATFLRRREGFAAVAGLGALLALGLMALREAGIWDAGYIPPYAVFAAFALAAPRPRAVPTR